MEKLIEACEAGLASLPRLRDGKSGDIIILFLREVFMTTTVGRLKNGTKVGADVSGLVDVPTNGYTLIFLKMVLGLWADNFPEESIQGITCEETLIMAGRIAGRNFDRSQTRDAYEAMKRARETLDASRRPPSGSFNPSEITART